MELTQCKPTKSEWDSIEIPVSSSEQTILELIIHGYRDVNIRLNIHESVLSFLKMKYSEKMEDYIYVSYLKPIIDGMIKIHGITMEFNINITNVKINSEDKIRLRNNTLDSLKAAGMYEYVLLQNADGILAAKKNKNTNAFHHNYYTLHNLLKNSISKLNRHVIEFCKTLLRMYDHELIKLDFVKHSVDILEKNKSLLKYQDMVLYDHQKEIFTICKNSPGAKLILYMAPTGTGKTMTPIGLSEGHRVLFVCAARHVGLALAKAAISMKKKIAFAFGCSCAEDIRLHYFAAKDYTINKRTGGIKKVDNTNGINVEIMICDIRSFVPAMLYMCAFNDPERILVYWDEPTITLDYEEHELHVVIKNNWIQNIIPTVILSSATLPKMHEICYCIADFQNRFENAEIFSINTYDCKKSISLIDKHGYGVLPHYLSENHTEIQKVVKHCEQNLTLLRYFDLQEVVEFIVLVIENACLNDERLNSENYFENLEDVNMKNIKLYYLRWLRSVSQSSKQWVPIYKAAICLRKPKILENISANNDGLTKNYSIGPGAEMVTSKNETELSRIQSVGPGIIRSGSHAQPTTSSSGIYVTTKDAYSLTDGPTMFICDDVAKVAKFCVQQAKIPQVVMTSLMENIKFNNVINEKLGKLEKELDFLKEQQENKISSTSSAKHSSKVTKQLDNVDEGRGQISKIMREIEQLTSLIKPIQLNDTFVPNKHHHIQKWASKMDSTNSFTSEIEEHHVNEIMLLDKVDDDWKILLMMGIGVYTLHENIKYTEIMKKLSNEQKLFMTIASSDYIYGTNIQNCHGYLSKGLNLTQEKIIQAFGRIGRGNIQQTYSIRLRDDDVIQILFTKEEVKREAVKMNMLLNSQP